MQRLLHSRYRLLVIGLFALAIPVIIYGAVEALKNNSNDVRDWLPVNTDETKRLMWFGQHFGSDEILMVSWEDCHLDDRRIDELAEKLTAPIQKENEISPHFRQVITPSQVMHSLTDENSLGLSDKMALERMQGWLLGSDGRTTCLVALIYVPEDFNPNRHAAVEHVYASADQIEGLSRETIYVAGTTIESVAIDKASNKNLILLSTLSFTLCFFIIWYCFRSLFLTWMVFSTALICQQLSLALIHYSGGKMDSVLLMVPSLVYVLSISAGVHMVNYYRDAVSDGGLSGAAYRALKDAWTPCFLAAGTTALGLVSLAVSQIIPVRKFGIYSASAVLLGIVVLMVLLPCELEQFRPLRWAKRLMAAKKNNSNGQQWLWLHRFVTRTHLGIVAGALILLIVSAWGVTQIRTTVNLHDMFTPEARVLKDYDWLETNVGPLVPIEIIVRIPIQAAENIQPYDTPLVDHLQLIAKVHDTIYSVDGIDAVISAITFAPVLPKGKIQGVRIADRTRRTALEKNLQAHRHRFVESRLLAVHTKAELWRITARAYAGSDINYETLLNELREHVEPVLIAGTKDGLGEMQAVYCGGIPLVHQAQGQLLKDLINSFLIAFAFIAIAMIALLRNFKAGMLSMIPNVLPCAIVFGTMGLLGIGIEIGSMLTATAAMGIAVDDTLHFITWFRRGLELGHSRSQAVKYAYSRCATAMVQTTLICGLGLLMMQFSQFMPIVRFAWMMFAMLSAAVFCDLIILPAILISPLGKVFQGKEKETIPLKKVPQPNFPIPS